MEFKLHKLDAEHDSETNKRFQSGCGEQVCRAYLWLQVRGEVCQLSL